MLSAYTRDESGSLQQIQVMCVEGDEGRLNISDRYNPNALTAEGTTELKGWGKDDGTADVYLTVAGREVIIPERIASKVRKHLEVGTPPQSHPEGCSCGSPDCPQWQADQEVAQ